MVLGAARGMVVVVGDEYEAADRPREVRHAKRAGGFPDVKYIFNIIFYHRFLLFIQGFRYQL